MVFESYPWKQDLLRRKRLITKYNSAEHFSKNDEATYTVIEKGIFYSAFIIRKLIDCVSKMSDEAVNYTLKVWELKPLRNIDLMHRWPEESSYDWENERIITVHGKNVCNWLIHSYVFFLIHGEDGRVEGFSVSSDFDRNKSLYRISLEDWLKYMDYIATDSIAAMETHFSEEKKEYVITRKERG